jgi:hypothetical protein
MQGFGKFNRMAHPGCNCLNPFCGETVAGSLSLRVQQLDVKCETKTRDNVSPSKMHKWCVGPGGCLIALFRCFRNGRSGGSGELSPYVIHDLHALQLVQDLHAVQVFVTIVVSVQYQVKRALLFEEGPPPAAVSQ